MIQLIKKYPEQMLIKEVNHQIMKMKEASITHDETKHFLETAKLLQAKRLQQDMQGIGQTIQDEFEDTNTYYEQAYHASENNIDKQVTIDFLSNPVYDTS